MRRLAERLIAVKTRGKRSAGIRSLASFPVFEKLRPPLAALVGSTGFDVLLARALALASPEAPWLRSLHVEADGSLVGLAELEAKVDAEKIAEGLVALLAHLLGLLKGFIGEDLTMRLLRGIWPNLVPNDWNSGN
jgi:hypothetical protein